MSRNSDKTYNKKTSIGGQALIEGLMMLGPDKKAIATRDLTARLLLKCRTGRRAKVWPIFLSYAAQCDWYLRWAWASRL